MRDRGSEGTCQTVVGASQRLSGLRWQKLLAQRQQPAPANWRDNSLQTTETANFMHTHLCIYGPCTGSGVVRRLAGWQMGRKKSGEVSAVDLVERRG